MISVGDMIVREKSWLGTLPGSIWIHEQVYLILSAVIVNNRYAQITLLGPRSEESTTVIKTCFFYRFDEAADPKLLESYLYLKFKKVT